MGCKPFVALQLKVPHHFIERFAGGRARRLESPATFGATKTPKVLLVDPYQLPAHGRLCGWAVTSTFAGKPKLLQALTPPFAVAAPFLRAVKLGQLQRVSLIRFLVCRCWLLNICFFSQQVRSVSLLADPVSGSSLPWLRRWGSPVANTVRWRNG
jgi:hypothetical protein